MSKIIGNTVGLGLPKPNLIQTDPSKGDFIKGKSILPTKVSQLENDAGYLEDMKPLHLTGAVEATYDGSVPVEVVIPQGGGGGKWEKVYECSAVEVTEAVGKIEIDLGGRVTNGKEEYVIQVELSKSTLETECKGVINCNLDGIVLGYFLLNWTTATVAFNFDLHGNLVTKELQAVNTSNSLIYNAINVRQQRSAFYGTNSNYEGKFVISFPAEWAGTYSVNIFVK